MSDDKITDEEITRIINNPWVTCDDLEELIVRIQNEDYASPWVEALLEFEGYLVLQGAG
jgi:hypothetical protein